MGIDTVAFLIAIGLFGGIWNAVAGGATLFTFPALMAAGLPPVVANATNYLALLPSNAAALPAYRKELKTVGAALWPLVIVSGAGAMVGAGLLVVSDEAFFVFVVPYLILAATFFFAFGERIRHVIVERGGERKASVGLYGALFVFSIYGGYFGAGLGIILLAIAQVMGFRSFHVANAIKNLLATSFTVLSIAIFGVGGLIAWHEAILVMIGSTAGGYLGGRYARLVNERYLRFAVIAFGLVLAGVYFVRSLGA
ncbi:MAG: sulfite exporter TauE/SafE family protein [Pseudomonadota bacterium]